MSFNVFIHNRDDHAKNFSFLVDEGVWKVSPCYDLVHSEGPRGERTTSIGGKRKNLTGEDILKVAKATGIKKETALNIIDKMSSLEFPRETI